MKKIVLLLCIVIILWSCKKGNTKDTIEEVDTSQESRDTTLTTKSDDESAPVTKDVSTDILSFFSTQLMDEEEIEVYSDETVESMAQSLGKGDIVIKDKVVKTPEYTISKDYLDDELEFINPTDYKNFIEGDIGVIGTDDVYLYKDIDGKDPLIMIPKGTIIPLYTEHRGEKNPDDEWSDDFHQFNDEYNYWYETEYNKQKGFVFGSYIAREGDSLSDILFLTDDYQRKNPSSVRHLLLRLAYHYRRDKTSSAFSDYNGTVSIPFEVKKALRKDHFALEKVTYGEYEHILNVENPDDMIALYKILHNDKMAGTFITTDFLVHTLHLLFDRMLQDTEEKIFYPLLKLVVSRYYETLLEYEKTIPAENTKYHEIIGKMKKYFLVPGHILGLELEPVANYPDDVKEELKLIAEAEGFVPKAPIFQYQEDYSQFKPRGHYTKTNILKKYFMAMMWFGRLHFYCVEGRSKDEDTISFDLTRSALLLMKIAKEDVSLYNKWRALFVPITYLIGESDDYNLVQYFSLADQVDFKNFGTWMADDTNISNFITTANSSLQGPKISGNTLMQSGDNAPPSGPAAPGGFRLFGQRFVFDSYITSQLTSTRICGLGRPMAKGIDIMGVLGNTLADTLLDEDRKKCDDFQGQYEKLVSQINGFTPDDWRSTFYNSYLRVIRESTIFDASNNFYFTQSPNWIKKSLLTAFGEWAELRHDTILYVKQSYGEKSGKGPEMTWRLDPIKRPVGYVEPNLGALYWIRSILEDSIQQLSQNGFMSEAFEQKYSYYKDIIDNLCEIVELEVQDKPISEEQNNFIYKVPYSLSRIVLPPKSAYVTKKSDLQMAIVADVHTSSPDYAVLEVATGIPYRIYVALNDGDGGKRIVEGYTYSYYEFHQPINNRLNDDQWKEKVYGDDQEYLEERKPAWLDIVN